MDWLEHHPTSKNYHLCFRFGGKKFRACFNWAVQTGVLLGSFPYKGIRFPKGEDKRPFMTWADIKRRIGRGGLAQNEIKKWWDCLFLDLKQVAVFVSFMKSHGSKPWMYPGWISAKRGPRPAARDASR